MHVTHVLENIHKGVKPFPLDHIKDIVTYKYVMFRVTGFKLKLHLIFRFPHTLVSNLQNYSAQYNYTLIIPTCINICLRHALMFIGSHFTHEFDIL